MHSKCQLLARSGATCVTDDRRSYSSGFSQGFPKLEDLCMLESKGAQHYVIVVGRDHCFAR
ncbi:hypothetical protein M378DRAFT_159332 [Amanita muscaria Koide BX008]|uniref:Uncharacterized protein n=1 Tax=Amanita muscaria (strain Koide BX008) TaxID=946122 RepID=A0A0C2X0B4_AMAMK|nr:hypothetical protein M378DRAFT_159332 [Amanita muscaria Koide BX008]